MIVDQGVMVSKEYSRFPKTPEMELHPQIEFSIISRTFVSGYVLPLRGHVVDIFQQPQATRVRYATDLFQQ